MTWILGGFTHKNILFLWGPKSPRMTKKKIEPEKFQDDRKRVSSFFLKSPQVLNHIYNNNKIKTPDWALFILNQILLYN